MRAFASTTEVETLGVKERASSLARLDRFDLSRLCVDNVVFTAGDTPPTDAGDTRGKFAESIRSECAQIQILI